MEFAVFKCEATANFVTGHVRVNSNDEDFASLECVGLAESVLCNRKEGEYLQ